MIEQKGFGGSNNRIEPFGAQPSTYGSGLVIQYNLLDDTNLWIAGSSPGSGNLGPANTAAGIGITNSFIKGGFFDQNGGSTGLQRVGEGKETHAVYAYGGCHPTTLRRHTLDRYPAG